MRVSDEKIAYLQEMLSQEIEIPAHMRVEVSEYRDLVSDLTDSRKELAEARAEIERLTFHLKMVERSYKSYLESIASLEAENTKLQIENEADPELCRLNYFDLGREFEIDFDGYQSIFEGIMAWKKAATDRIKEAKSALDESIKTNGAQAVEIAALKSKLAEIRQHIDDEIKFQKASGSIGGLRAARAICTLAAEQKDGI